MIALLLACARSSLELLPPPPPDPIDDRVAIHGEVCTAAPDDVQFPTRVLFLVDASESMEANDPPDPATGRTRREEAVHGALDRLFSEGDDVRVSLVRFSSQAQPLTVTYDDSKQFESYFTDDQAIAAERVAWLAETDRTTNYLNALSEAYAQLRDEMGRSELASLALSAYHVVLISDGIPDAEGAETDADIVDAVSAIRSLEGLMGVGEVAVHTALISTGSAEVDAQSSALLAEMADAGGGEHRAFDGGEVLSFLHLDLTALKRVFTLRDLSVLNLSALVSGDTLHADSDGDGLSDADEAWWGSQPWVPDSDGDGCRDGVEANLPGATLSPLIDDCGCFVPDYCFDEDLDGLCDSGCTDADGDQLCDCIDEDADGICDPENYPDSDGDGLTDCEEAWTGTSRSDPDSDGDGLTDLHEIRFGTSPDIHDADDDLDWDRTPNGEEVRAGTDPIQATADRYGLSYRYAVAEARQVSGGQTCYTFDVANVSLVEVLPSTEYPATAGPGGQGFSGRSRALIYAGEVPSDNQQSVARVRVACVEAQLRADGNFRDPPSGRLSVGDADFVSLPDFDPARHCVAPGGQP